MRLLPFIKNLPQRKRDRGRDICKQKERDRGEKGGRDKREKREKKY